MAKKLSRFGLTQRTALLLLLVAALSVSWVLMTPKDAEAVCCGWEVTTIYYFDSAKTQYAGECYTDGCGGGSGCSGTTPTPYYTRIRSCCDRCVF